MEGFSDLQMLGVLIILIIGFSLMAWSIISLVDEFYTKRPKIKENEDKSNQTNDKG